MKGLRACTKKGAIGIPNQEGKYTICSYKAIVAEAPVKAGIYGGRILELIIKEKGETACLYDQGWKIQPKTDAAVNALAILEYDYGK